jgi:hypothetical protein
MFIVNPLLTKLKRSAEKMLVIMYYETSMIFAWYPTQDGVSGNQNNSESVISIELLVVMCAYGAQSSKSTFIRDHSNILFDQYELI